MPDRNKLQTYKEECVTIVSSCATCEHASFPNPQAAWGGCKVHSYSHAKHDPTPRPLPAHVAFVCPKWERNKKLINVRELGAYADLLEKKS